MTVGGAESNIGISGLANISRWAGRHIAVVSPHLDDAVLSVGATIADAVAAGATVSMVTALAGDPDVGMDAHAWDSACGFASSRDSVMARRREDAAAASVLGAETHWLPFFDKDYDQPDRDAGAIWSGLEPLLEGADVVMAPGHPLAHPDHLWVADIVTIGLSPDRLILYAEQPYLASGASRDGLPSIGPARAGVNAATRRARELRRLPVKCSDGNSLPTDWATRHATRNGRASKQAAIRCYDSQLRGLGRTVGARIALYEWVVGGEAFRPAAG